MPLCCCLEAEGSMDCVAEDWEQPFPREDSPRLRSPSVTVLGSCTMLLFERAWGQNPRLI